MAGIYIHIPFCKQACHYCDFHFSTSLKKKKEMLQAIKKELSLRKDQLKEPVTTIYFGGGTPSLLTEQEIQELIDEIYNCFDVHKEPEITLEANPDDLNEKSIKEWERSAINRLSLGIQSFDQQDLIFMNRAHNRKQALDSMHLAFDHFENVSIDLIYGVPGMSEKSWRDNLKQAFDFPLTHLSSYALTVEPKTALDHFIKTGKVNPPDEEVARTHFEILMEEADAYGLIHYEVSNFAREGFISKHNTSYWLGDPYLGIGPSAHSYDKISRSWNPSNNAVYRTALNRGELVLQTEALSENDKINELVLTSLRTIWGLSLLTVAADFGEIQKERILRRADKYLEEGLLVLDQNQLKITPQGYFLVDGITADLFIS